jgi:hypothetical protein
VTKSCASQPRITSTPELNHADNVHFLSLNFYSSAHFRRLGIEEGIFSKEAFGYTAHL